VHSGNAAMEQLTAGEGEARDLMAVEHAVSKALFDEPERTEGESVFKTVEKSCDTVGGGGGVGGGVGAAVKALF